MGRKVLAPTADGKPIGMYSAGFSVDPARLVFVSGQVAMNAEGHVVGEGDLKAQAAQVYRNLAAVLAEAGCTLRDVVKFTTFLVRNEDWTPFAEWRRAEYPKLFPDGVYPANTGMVVVELARPSLLLEVEAIAVRPGGPTRPRARPRARAASRRGSAAPKRKTGRAGGAAPERPTGGVVVTVRYVFGLARTADGRDTLSLELPPGSTVFEALRRLGCRRSSCTRRSTVSLPQTARCSVTGTR